LQVSYYGVAVNVLLGGFKGEFLEVLPIIVNKARGLRRLPCLNRT
jgi:hypothetical protein